MSNARGKAIDNTHLSIDAAEARGFLHRDYIAHCFRWSHVARFLQRSARYKTAKVLDIGCGKEMPLAKLLYSSRLLPERYAGIDVNDFEAPAMFANAKFQPDVFCGDVCDLDAETLGFHPNVVVCFEVIEHIEPEHVRRLLTTVKELCEPGATIFMSTPNWDPAVGAAANHVNEMTYEALGALFEDMQFEIHNMYGTFASMKDYKDQLVRDGYGELFEELRDYYDTNVLATFFAPLYPALSRNVIWRLGIHDGPIEERTFNTLERVPQPWTSSEHWRELNGTA